MIRKFFDPATEGEQGGSGAQEQGGSIASLMAKYGTQTSTGEPLSTPIVINQEPKVTPEPAQEPAPAETATQPPPAETANDETPTQQPAVEPTPEPTPQAVAAEVKPPSLQEVLKQHQPDAVLKELGYDDKVVGLAKKLAENPKMTALFNHWESNGDVGAYLKALQTDYSKMPAEEVMRHQLKQDYPKASEAAINALYKEEIVERYKLDPDKYSEEEIENGRLLLDAKADRYRDSLIENQQTFLLPKPPEPKAVEPDNRNQAVQQEVEVYKSKVAGDPYTRDIIANKGISFGEGEDKFFYPLADPGEIIDTVYDSDKWTHALFDVSGQDDKKILTPNVKNQVLIGLVAKHGEAFLTAYAKHYKSIGGKAAIVPIDNASQPNQNAASQSTPGYTTPAAAMAREGRLT